MIFFVSEPDFKEDFLPPVEPNDLLDNLMGERLDLAELSFLCDRRPRM